jgi:hypothetical protein
MNSNTISQISNICIMNNCIAIIENIDIDIYHLFKYDYYIKKDDVYDEFYILVPPNVGIYNVTTDEIKITYKIYENNSINTILCYVKNTKHNIKNLVSRKIEIIDTESEIYKIKNNAFC